MLIDIWQIIINDTQVGSPRQADLVEGEGRGGAGLRLPHDGQHYRGGNNAVEYGGGHGWQEDIFPKNDRGEVADIYMGNNFVIDGHNTFCPVLLKLVNAWL